MSWVDEGVGQQVVRKAHAEQRVIAELAGTLDSFLPVAKCSLRLAGEVINHAEGGERFDEQPNGAELASERDSVFTKPPCCGYIIAASGEGDADQCRPEQFWIRLDLGPVQRR